MPVILRNKFAVPLTLPFPFRGILGPGRSILVDLTEEEAAVALAISAREKNTYIGIEASNATGDFDELATGNAAEGLLIDEVMTANETGTVVNVGAGVGLFRDKISNTFNFKTLVAGTNVSITPSGSDVLIVASSVGEANVGANVGTGDGIFRNKTGVTLNFKTLTAGAGVTLTPGTDELEIAATGEANSASNVGTGSGIFRNKTGVTINLKSIVAGANVTVTPGADTVTIASAAPGEVNLAANVGIGDGIFRDKTGVTLNLKSIIAGTNIGVSAGADALTLSTTAEINLGANVGATGEGIFRNKTGATLNFKKLIAGANITLTPAADTLTVASAAPGEVNLTANVGTGSGIFRDKTGVTANLRSLKAGMNVTLTPTADEITIAATGTGESNLGANVGGGAGVFRDKTGSTLNFKTLTAGANITLTPSADELEIAATGGGTKAYAYARQNGTEETDTYSGFDRFTKTSTLHQSSGFSGGTSGCQVTYTNAATTNFLATFCGAIIQSASPVRFEAIISVNGNDDSKIIRCRKIGAHGHRGEFSVSGVLTGIAQNDTIELHIRDDGTAAGIKASDWALTLVEI